jgi:hypothetical protein
VISSIIAKTNNAMLTCTQPLLQMTLTSQQRVLKRNKRKSLSNHLLIALFFLVPAAFISPVAFAQKEALKIEANGNIGIGTAKPLSLLEVNGTAHLRGASNGIGLIVDSAGNVGMGMPPTVNDKLSVAGDGNFFGNLFIRQANHKPTGQLLVMGWWKQGASFIQASESPGNADLILQPNLGNVIIGGNAGNTSAKAKLVVAGANAQQGLDLSTDNQIANMRVIQNTNGSDKDLWIGFGSGETSSVHLFANNRETMTVKGGNWPALKGSVKVDGTLTAETLTADRVNGERPPLMYTIGDNISTDKYAEQIIDIGKYCGDANGCTIKLLLNHKINHEVRALSAELYFQQPYQEGRIHGFSTQGGNYETAFVLGGSPGEKKDIIHNHGWDWISVRNYGSAQVGSETNAYSGYKIQFMTHPHVSATVIIYDR